ncbi:MAG: hypothetical protein ACHQ1D_03135 [Nitrososphaerales archaeon]
MKLTFEGVLKECNRLAFERELQERSAWFKSRLAKLDLDYNKGLIDIATYNKRQSEILKDLDSISKQKSVDIQGGTSLEF